MQTNHNSIWWARIATFVLSMVVAASAAYWGLKIWSLSQPSKGGATAIASAAPVDPQAVAQVLGGGSSPLRTADLSASTASSRFVLQGVVADSSSGGAALISVDGKPAKPFRVGGIVDGRLLLQSVVGRRAVLATTLDGPQEMALELPPLGK